MVHRRRIPPLLAVLAALAACGPREPGPGTPAPDAGPTPAATPSHREAVEALVAPLLDGEWVAGLAIGLVTPDGDEFYGYGRTGEENPAVPGPDTLFELGSVTKVFTALLLAREVVEGRLALDQPLASLLPAGVVLPERDGAAITLEQLATHTSGLPRMPDDFAPADPLNPYADLSWERLAAFLARYELPRAPGVLYEYSNLGAGLLGDALARHAGTTYEALLGERILGPLGLGDTAIALSDDQRRRMAQGHDADGNPVPAWDFLGLAGAGALRTTVADLTLFLHRQLDAGGPLAEAIALTQVRRHDDDSDGGVALGWHVGSSGRLWHNGGTGGFHSFVAFDPERKLGVAVLASTGTFLVDAVGASLLALLVGEDVPLELPPTARLTEEQLERCVGVYELEPGTTVTVTRDGTRLLAQITGQPALRLWPENETTFRWRVVDAAVRFEPSAPGPASSLTIVQDGTETTAARLEE
jgi:D-alanyl-D-alanine-carboxypeptidase/D-alanyl-D-alanine-endopeptidase